MDASAGDGLESTAGCSAVFLLRHPHHHHHRSPLHLPPLVSSAAAYERRFLQLFQRVDRDVARTASGGRVDDDEVDGLRHGQRAAALTGGDEQNSTSMSSRSDCGAASGAHRISDVIVASRDKLSRLQRPEHRPVCDAYVEQEAQLSPTNRVTHLSNTQRRS